MLSLRAKRRNLVGLATYQEGVPTRLLRRYAPGNDMLFDYFLHVHHLVREFFIRRYSVPPSLTIVLNVNFFLHVLQSK
jgi:hypothetical protein